ncbi:MAG: stage 0 sporulation protein [Lentisphaerae bacterium]|nr:stage 0 sporulation protein [Lentisphaerota bacterium]
MHGIAHVVIDDGPALECFVPEGLAIHESDQCIVDLEGVLEYGCVTRLEPAGDTAADHMARLPRVLRQATLQDQAKASENTLRSRMARETCEGKVREYGLDIRLVRVRYSFDRHVLRVLFACDDRVDFRDMVRDLSGELRTRIEMHQIGVRDEAAIIGGVGPCGRELCCCTWLHHFESINVKMAKIQRLSLNPGAISGMCGRLKCCLRYECEQYRELLRALPRMGARVECAEGRGCVIDSNVMRQRVRIRLENDRIVECPAEDLRRAPFRPSGSGRGEDEA